MPSRIHASRVAQSSEVEPLSLSLATCGSLGVHFGGVLQELLKIGLLLRRRDRLIRIDDVFALRHQTVNRLVEGPHARGDVANFGTV